MTTPLTISSHGAQTTVTAAGSLRDIHEAIAELIGAPSPVLQLSRHEEIENLRLVLSAAEKKYGADRSAFVLGARVQMIVQDYENRIGSLGPRGVIPNPDEKISTLDAECARLEAEATELRKQNRQIIDNEARLQVEIGDLGEAYESAVAENKRLADELEALRAGAKDHSAIVALTHNGDSFRTADGREIKLRTVPPGDLEALDSDARDVFDGESKIGRINRAINGGWYGVLSGNSGDARVLFSARDKAIAFVAGDSNVVEPTAADKKHARASVAHPFLVLNAGKPIDGGELEEVKTPGGKMLRLVPVHPCNGEARAWRVINPKKRLLARIGTLVDGTWHGCVGEGAEATTVAGVQSREEVMATIFEAIGPEGEKATRAPRASGTDKPEPIAPRAGDRNEILALLRAGSYVAGDAAFAFGASKMAIDELRAVALEDCELEFALVEVAIANMPKADGIAHVDDFVHAYRGAHLARERDAFREQVKAGMAAIGYRIQKNAYQDGDGFAIFGTSVIREDIIKATADLTGFEASDVHAVMLDWLGRYGGERTAVSVETFLAWMCERRRARAEQQAPDAGEAAPVAPEEARKRALAAAVARAVAGEAQPGDASIIFLGSETLLTTDAVKRAVEVGLGESLAREASEASRTVAGTVDLEAMLQVYGDLVRAAQEQPESPAVATEAEPEAPKKPTPPAQPRAGKLFESIETPMGVTLRAYRVSAEPGQSAAVDIVTDGGEAVGRLRAYESNGLTVWEASTIPVDGRNRLAKFNDYATSLRRLFEWTGYAPETAATEASTSPEPDRLLDDRERVGLWNYAEELGVPYADYKKLVFDVCQVEDTSALKVSDAAKLRVAIDERTGKVAAAAGS